MSLQRDPEGIELKTLRRLVDFKDKQVLEVGCGEGRLTFKYAALARQVIAFDPDRDSLRIARADMPYDRQKQIHFVEANAEHIPVSKEKFDLAILAWSL